MRPSRLAALVLQTVAAILLAAGLWLIHYLMLVYGGGVPVAATVAAVFVLGAMRRPWFFLAVAVLLRLALPSVSDLGDHDLFVACFSLALPCGALAGLILRAFRGRSGVPPRPAGPVLTPSASPPEAN
jgi:hypothetical protein